MIGRRRRLLLVVVSGILLDIIIFRIISFHDLCVANGGYRAKSPIFKRLIISARTSSLSYLHRPHRTPWLRTSLIPRHRYSSPFHRGDIGLIGLAVMVCPI